MGRGNYGRRPLLGPQPGNRFSTACVHSTAMSSRDAMELISAQTFDLIILDIVMPEELGTVLLKKLREAGNRVPVIIYSVRVDATLEKEMLQMGANEVMHKSVSLEVLIDRTEKVLRASGKRPPKSAEITRKLLVIDDDKITRQLITFFF